MSNEARIGDVTNHGGKIVTGASKRINEGQPTARIGDIHACPLHGPNPIVTGSATVICEGSPVARIGDKTACGAVIVSGAGKTIIGT